jgi:hypothetical protein
MYKYRRRQWRTALGIGLRPSVGGDLPNVVPNAHIKKKNMNIVAGPQILKRFYSCTIESILTGCITAWYGNCFYP